MNEPVQFKDLQPGDVLLYNDGSLVDRLICFRTWSDVAHVEVYRGIGLSFASRNGLGVNIYPFRSEGLRYVRRPRRPFHLTPALNYADFMRGTKYGWFELLAFYLFPQWFIRTLEKLFRCRGIVCSPYANFVEANGGVECFSWDYPENRISPRDFLTTPALRTAWSYKLGFQEAARGAASIADNHKHTALGSCACE